MQRKVRQAHGRVECSVAVTRVSADAKESETSSWASGVRCGSDQGLR
jgi:hypothetical protein